MARFRPATARRRAAKFPNLALVLILVSLPAMCHADGFSGVDTIVPEPNEASVAPNFAPKVSAMDNTVESDFRNPGLKTPSDVIMMQNICSNLDNHWMSKKPLVAALREHVGELADECAKITPRASQVILLADRIVHHLSCRAHGSSIHGSCGDKMLGKLSEDENVHNELLQLSHIRNAANPVGIDCSSYRQGNLGTSRIKDSEQNSFFKPFRHFELLAYCMCTAKGQHYCASRSYEELEEMAPSKPETTLVASTRAGTSARQRTRQRTQQDAKKNWENPYELKNRDDLEDAFTSSAEGYLDPETGGACMNPFDFLTKKENEGQDDRTLKRQNQKEFKGQGGSSIRKKGQNGFGKFLKALDTCSVSVSGCRTRSKWEVGLTCTIQVTPAIPVQIKLVVSIDKEKAEAKMYATCEGYDEMYQIVSKIEFVKKFLERVGLEKEGYNFGWASYNWNSKVANIGFKRPIHSGPLIMTVSGDATVSFARDNHDRDVCSNADLKIDLDLELLFVNFDVFQGEVFESSFTMHEGKLDINTVTVFGNLNLVKRNPPLCRPKEATPRVHCSAGFSEDETSARDFRAYQKYGSGHRGFYGPSWTFQKPQFRCSGDPHGLCSLPECIQQSGCTADQKCIGIVWEQGDNYYAPLRKVRCFKMMGDPTEVKPLPANEAMCIKPCPDGYDTQVKVTGNSDLGAITIGSTSGTGYWRWNNKGVDPQRPRPGSVKMDAFTGLGGRTAMVHTANNRVECAQECNKRVKGHSGGTCLGFRFNFGGTGGQKCQLVLDKVRQILGASGEYEWQGNKGLWRHFFATNDEQRHPHSNQFIDEHYISCVRSCSLHSQSTIRDIPAQGLPKPHAGLASMAPNPSNQVFHTGAFKADQITCNSECCLDPDCDMFDHQFAAGSCTLMSTQCRDYPDIVIDGIPRTCDWLAYHFSNGAGCMGVSREVRHNSNHGHLTTSELCCEKCSKKVQYLDSQHHNICDITTWNQLASAHTCFRSDSHMPWGHWSMNRGDRSEMNKCPQSCNYFCSDIPSFTITGNPARNCHQLAHEWADGQGCAGSASQHVHQPYGKTTRQLCCATCARFVQPGKNSRIPDHFMKPYMLDTIDDPHRPPWVYREGQVFRGEGYDGHHFGPAWYRDDKIIQMWQEYTGTPKCMNYRGGGSRNSPNMVPENTTHRQPESSCGCFTYGTDCEGTELLLNTGDSISAIKTASACQHKCRSYYSCQAFVFDYHSKWCKLFSHYTGEKECFGHTMPNKPEQPRYVSGPATCRGCMTRPSSTCPCLELKDECPSSLPAKCGLGTPANTFCDASDLTPSTGDCRIQDTLEPNCVINGRKTLILYRSSPTPPGNEVPLFKTMPGHGWCQSTSNTYNYARLSTTESSSAYAAARCARDPDCVAYTHDPRSKQLILFTPNSCTDDCHNTEWQDDRSKIVKASTTGMPPSSHAQFFDDARCYVKIESLPYRRIPGYQPHYWGPRTSPCDLAKWKKTTLQDGDGYYWDPHHGKGYCAVIRAANKQVTLTAYKNNWWYHHSSGATYLPKKISNPRVVKV